MAFATEHPILAVSEHRPVGDIPRTSGRFEVVSDYQPSGDQPQAIAEYRALKQGLARRFAGDPDADRYAQEKEPWLAQAYCRAQQWATSTAWRPAETGTVGPSA